MKQAIRSAAKRKRSANGRANREYLSLVERFPLRPLKSDKDYDEAIAVVDTLAVKREDSLSPAEQDYLGTLTLLIEQYDCQHHTIEFVGYDGISMLEYLMSESGMTQAELGRLLGNRALASLLLNRRRQLSKQHIRKLAQHFKVSPGLFLANVPGRASG
jgi:HTH-type transcriptional regulator/antitoxin HigA